MISTINYKLWRKACLFIRLNNTGNVNCRGVFGNLMENVPSYAALVFGVAVVATLFLVWLSHPKDKLLFIFWFLMGAASSYLVLTDVTLNAELLSPKLLLIILPSTLIPLLYLLTKRGKALIHAADDDYLHYIHTVRIAVEFVLLWLHKAQVLPVELTFEGWNYDIIIGMTAPFIAQMGFQKKFLTRKILLGWNVLGILFLTNIVINAALSVPGPLHLLSLDMPNLAVLKFPYQLLPTLIVPALFFSHVVAIIRLVKKEVDVESPEED